MNKNGYLMMDHIVSIGEEWKNLDFCVVIIYYEKHCVQVYTDVKLMIIIK